jgi:hypothetical protein
MVSSYSMVRLLHLVCLDQTFYNGLHRRNEGGPAHEPFDLEDRRFSEGPPAAVLDDQQQYGFKEIGSLTEEATVMGCSDRSGVDHGVRVGT